MILRRYGTFTGGIDLPEDKDLTIGLPIRRCRKLAHLRVPLAPCGGTAAQPLVAVGEEVTAGRKIASAAGESSVDVFAPLSGRVKGFTTVSLAGRYGLFASPAIELDELSEPQALSWAGEVFDWRKADAETLRSRIEAGGLTALRDGPEPLGPWLRRARDHRCVALIANIMEDQPYVTADHRLMVEHGRDVLRGLALLAKAMAAAKVYLVADWRRTDDYRDLTELARLHGIERVALPHKYPTGADAILVKILTRREMPPGGTTMNVGAAVIGAAACLAAYRQVACGAPPCGRVLTVSGERATDVGNFYVPFGAGCLELASNPEPPVIHGGPMTGVRCGPDVVVGPGTTAVLAIEAAPAPVPGPCIRCGWCRDHCPTRLNVAAMNDAFELGQVRQARRLGAMACVECGVCSYLCPARLPLTQRMKHLKHAIVAKAGP